MIHELARLRQASIALYASGKWVRPATKDPKADAELWEKLREALGLPPGTATNLGVNG
jgi:hypothetical protein